MKRYYVYILTNPDRTSLYVGVTNNLVRRLNEHWKNRGQPQSFAGRYYCYNLIYFEEFKHILDAIAREKEFKRWSRAKKVSLITNENPTWKIMNEEVCDCWPPKQSTRRF